MTVLNRDIEAIQTRIEVASRFVEPLVSEIRKVIVGQDDMVEKLLVALLANGHVLLEGVPGLAKTLTVKTLAQTIDTNFQRIQFTPDLLPADLIGTLIYDQKEGEFRTKKGPIFSNLILADEINRSPAKVQSALLEAMQERSVTVRGRNNELQPPFFVLATQNPIELEGTYPLPEAQLDRFLFNVILDYLDGDDEMAVLERFTTRVDIPTVAACTSGEEILKFQWLVRQVPVAESINRYTVDLVRATRPADPTAPDVVKRYVNFGASVRATMFLTLAAKARALLEGRYHVTREDVQALALPVLRHRVLVNYFAESDNVSVDDVLRGLLDPLAG